MHCNSLRIKMSAKSDLCMHFYALLPQCFKVSCSLVSSCCPVRRCWVQTDLELQKPTVLFSWSMVLKACPVCWQTERPSNKPHQTGPDSDTMFPKTAFSTGCGQEQTSLPQSDLLSPIRHRANSIRYRPAGSPLTPLLRCAHTHAHRLQRACRGNIMNALCQLR